MNNRSGFYRTNLSGSLSYKSFVPSPLPPSPAIEFTPETIQLLTDAHAALSALNATAVSIPNTNLFISMYVRKEALMSSQIEGTQATLDDILDPTIDANANLDVCDVVNYVSATEYALNRLHTLPLCNRLLGETHKILMQGTRGREKSPGEFRHSQNWIGSEGCTIQTARYIPPNPDDMQTALSDLEKYINSEDSADPLVQAALIHYQFETIHPFLDGNGRIGRLLITLFLTYKGILTTPALYISYYLKKNRVEYYDRISAVRETGNYEQWVLFFLSALGECATDATRTIHTLSSLSISNRNKISQMGRASNTTLKVFEYLEQSPIIEIGKTADALHLSYNTVSSAVSRLQAAGILTPSPNKRNRTFSYTEYLDILRDGTTSE